MARLNQYRTGKFLGGGPRSRPRIDDDAASLPPGRHQRARRGALGRAIGDSALDLGLDTFGARGPSFDVLAEGVADEDLGLRELASLLEGGEAVAPLRQEVVGRDQVRRARIQARAAGQGDLDDAFAAGAAAV